MIARPSPNFDTRGGAAIDILLLHYTGMQSGGAALERLCDPQAKVSAHYMIEEDGTIYKLVAEKNRAWHAGVSYWAGARDINARSIGIEIVNPGHEFGYRAFPEAQITALRGLARDILRRQGIPPARVLGHSDVAPLRKQDPGELFDWQSLARAGIGLWPESVGTNNPDWSDATFIRMLARYGYDVVGPEGVDPALAAKAAIEAFERHFRPARLTGKPDAELRGILKALIDAAAIAS